ncbi:MAG: tetratricopeptide repeat protein [Deltaproteobacteria bacterium]|nr:tetratricopeptide repeat protein [Nannocystaceae bacterium]
MLERLDSIDWASLTHAYGSAADVPAMLRALVSEDAEQRGAALHAAYGNIFHQGTRYAATPAAIGALVEIVGDQHSPDRAAVLALLVHCVAGYFAPTHGPRTASGTIWGETVEPMLGYGETLELLAACERAAAPALPIALELLGDRDPRLRAHAAWLLAALWAQADRDAVLPRVHARFGVETDPHVRAMLVFALTHLCPLTDASLARIFTDEASALVRVLAAMGSARRGQATGAMAGAMLEWLSDDELDAAYRSLPFGSEGLPSDIASSLPELGQAALQQALPTLTERLRTADDFGAIGILAAALAAVFGAGALAPGAALESSQRELLEVLVHNQAFWSLGNAFELMHARGLPSDRGAMAELLGVVVVRDRTEDARIGARAMSAFGTARALQAWLEVLDHFPDDAEALTEAGYLLGVSNEHARALELLERALGNGLSEGRLFGKAMFAIGTSAFALGDGDTSQHAFERAQPHLGPHEREQARQNRIAMLQRLGRFEEALALDQVRTPENADDHYHRGLAEVKAGRYHECIASITASLEVDPDRANAHYTIACAYALLGDHDRALASIARALECDPELAPDIAGDADFAGLADDPRFVALVTVDE